MQLRAIVLYNSAGERQEITFRLGGLNVVTGTSATGKSALLDIVEFCLGRNTVTMPLGPITHTVAWYAVLLQLDDVRAFVARPAPVGATATSQVAMLELGAELEPLPFARLQVNSDADGVREQLGRLVGIGENAGEVREGALRNPLEAHLGHAMLLCLQRQSEIANRDFLFHRQGEEGMRLTIQDTLPYFLGAVPRDQAVQRQRLVSAQRDLRRAEEELTRAEASNREAETTLSAMVAEAVAAGLLSEDQIEGRIEMISALQGTLADSQPPAADDVVAERRYVLERERGQLRLALREAGDQRKLLEDIEGGEQGYEGTVSQQMSRLRSLDLFAEGDGGVGGCPVGGQSLAEPDASVSELRELTDRLRAQLESVHAARPRRRQALIELTQATDIIRQRLRANEGAIAGIMASREENAGARTRAEEQAFTRGRIQQFLTTLRSSGDVDVDRLRQRVAARRRTVQQLEGVLNPDEVREQLTSRLAIVGLDMTRWASQLQLEHAGNVRLDMSRLTVVADTDAGPAPLFRIGSAENWMGFHVVAHLALHRYFARQGLPVPRFLMLDQPTQVYYPSEVERAAGIPEGEDDRAAVRRTFELLRNFVEELNPGMQIVVCDHANLPEDWFQEAVVQNWRDGRKLIPGDWIEAGGPPGRSTDEVGRDVGA